jgi:hypothetical protein
MEIDWDAKVQTNENCGRKSFVPGLSTNERTNRRGWQTVAATGIVLPAVTSANSRIPFADARPEKLEQRIRIHCQRRIPKLD